MEEEEQPHPPLPLQPPQQRYAPRSTRRGPKITVHHSSFVPMPQTQRPDGQLQLDPPADPNLPDFNYTLPDISDPNVKILAVRRSKNRVAHGLVGNVGTNLWWGNVPEPVPSIFCIDLTSMNE